jgi:hypothetical protein
MEAPLLGHYEHPAACPEIAALSRDPALIAIAEQYLGKPPRHTGTELWWTFPSPVTEQQKSDAAQLFHFDLDDFRFLKFFFYLTDVGDGAGPHVVVLGTHRRKTLTHQAVIRRQSDADIVRAYGAERVRRILLPAGSGFAEDTFCFHKGETPTRDRRLLLQFEFCVNDFYTRR